MVAILEDAIMFKSALLNNKIYIYILLKERKPAKTGKTFKIFCAELSSLNYIFIIYLNRAYYII